MEQDAYAATKKSMRNKKGDDGDASSQFKVPSQLSPLKPESVWDLTAVHGFLETICRLLIWFSFVFQIFSFFFIMFQNFKFKQIFMFF